MVSEGALDAQTITGADQTATEMHITQAGIGDATTSYNDADEDPSKSVEIVAKQNDMAAPSADGGANPRASGDDKGQEDQGRDGNN